MRFPWREASSRRKRTPGSTSNSREPADQPGSGSRGPTPPAVDAGGLSGAAVGVEPTQPGAVRLTGLEDFLSSYPDQPAARHGMRVRGFKTVFTLRLGIRG